MFETVGHTYHSHSIIHIVANKLDKNSLREWKELKYRTVLPTLQEFMDLLKRKSDILQFLEEPISSKTYFFTVNMVLI